MNPLHESVEETFRTQKVRVYARDNTEYVGYLDRDGLERSYVEEYDGLGTAFE